MRLIKRALLVLILLDLILLGFGMLLPSTWTVERAVIVRAPTAAIYPFVASFKTGWPQWSAFDFEDPAIQYSYSGPDEGAGATRHWISRKMGDGHQTITQANPASGITFELEMEQNKFKLKGQISFEPAGPATKVTWTDSGNVGGNPLYRYLALMLRNMTGATIEKSLATLKQKVESLAHQR